MKYVPSAFVGRLSRSAGSTTAAHNRFGSYFRNRVIPTNPASTSQTTVRSRFTTNAQAWRALSDSQRAGWVAFGSSIVRTSTLGETYTLTGQQAYQMCNQNLATLGVAAIADAPAFTYPTEILTVTPVATG